MRTLRAISILLVFLGNTYADTPPPAVQTVDVSMNDGTNLKTDFSLPAKGGPAFPTILMRSPYPRAAFKGQVANFNKQGYAVVVQDVRGTGDSQGAFTGFRDDGWSGNHDGADTVEWVLKQPWCNGKIATVGGSAGANTESLLAPATTKLRCQILDSAACAFYADVAYPGGVWRPEQTDTWFKGFGDKGETARQALRAHPMYDAFWEGLNSEAKAPEITSPGMHIGGWFDIFKEGTIRAFTSRQYSGGEGAKGHQKLIMRWSGHGEYTSDLSLKFPQNVFDVKVSKKYDAFVSHWLTEDNGINKEPPVQYYVIGDDSPGAPGMEWRTAKRWPPFPPHEKNLYLYGEALQEAPPEQYVSRSYAFDPANPCPTTGGCNLTLPIGPYDQRPLLDRKDILLFKGPVLNKPLETTGKFRVTLYVSTDAPDTDFTAKVLDVYPPGDDRHILVMESIRRLKFRDGFDKAAAPLAPDQTVPVEIDLGNMSWIFNKGHRLALLVSSSNYPHFEVNPNTGDDFPEPGNTKIANNTIQMGPKWPSALVIPVRLPDQDSDKDGVSDEREWDKGTDINDPKSK